MDEKSKNLLEDMNFNGAAAGGVSDHYLVKAKVRMKGSGSEKERRLLLKES